MKAVLLVGLGGFAGSALRYLSGMWLLRFAPLSGFPLGTFVVNVLGSFLIGFIYALTAKDNLLGPSAKLLLATGFCGGFTTFSTFSYENLNLLQEGQWGAFSAYALSSFVLGLLAVFAGLWLGRLVAGR